MNNQPTCVHDPKKSTISLPLQTILSPHAALGCLLQKIWEQQKQKLARVQQKTKKKQINLHACMIPNLPALAEKQKKNKN